MGHELLVLILRGRFTPVDRKISSGVRASRTLWNKIAWPHIHDTAGIMHPCGSAERLEMAPKTNGKGELIVVILLQAR
jgi:hypothetical protein